MRKGAGESGSRNDTGALLKEQNLITLLNDSSTEVDCQIAIFGDFLCQNQLNSSMHGKGYKRLDVFETSSRLNIKHSCGSIELKIEEYLGFWH